MEISLEGRKEKERKEKEKKRKKKEREMKEGRRPHVLPPIYGTPTYETRRTKR